MKDNITNIAENTYELKEKIVEIEKENTHLKNELSDKIRENILLTEQISLLKQKYFGKSSEKSTKDNPEEPGLFNEAELTDDEEKKEEVKDVNEEKIVVKEHERKKGRKPLSPDLPREEVFHDIPEEEKRCGCCGKEKPFLGDEISEELDVIPAQIKVIKHIRKKYGICNCNESRNKKNNKIITASMPERLLPGGIATPGLLAFLFTSKFNDAIPYYRLEKIIQRYGADLSRQTMCNMQISASLKCQSLLELMWEDVMQSEMIQMDETPLQVVNEFTQNSYMWVTIGYTDNIPTILYHYHPTRSGNVPLNLLKDYKGYLQTDGYKGYEESGKLPEVKHVGCWAHARRKFDEALKASKNSNSANQGLSFIRDIYRYEKILRLSLDNFEIDRKEFVLKRKEKVEPILESMYKWLKKRVLEIIPESLMGKAINYTLKEWPKLIKYLEQWYLTPDNNRAENAIRPFVLGRKNWLFSMTPSGAHSSATFFSLIETAKANGLEPYYFLRYIFTRLPLIKDNIDDLKKLLPKNISPDMLKI